MIGYVTLGTNDLPRAARFYDELLGSIGAKRLMELGSFIVWGTAMDASMLAITPPHDKNRATVGNGVMVALRAASKAQVDQIYRKALELGGTDEGAPRPARRRLPRRLLPRPRRQQAERVLHGLGAGVARSSSTTGIVAARS